MDPYKIRIGGVVADPYRIAIEYGLDPILGQALKKILRCGRKHKSAEEDAKEVITTMERWLEIQRERAVEVTYAGPTQEQIAERNRQVAHNAALGSVILCQGEPITKYEVGPEDLTLGVKTNMEKLLDERDGETSWP